MRLTPTFIDLLLLKKGNGEPWVPPWWLSFIVVPISTVVMFISDELSGWRGKFFPNVEPKTWSEIDWSSLPSYAVWFLGMYFLILLPIFVGKNLYWKKTVQGRVGPTK